MCAVNCFGTPNPQYSTGSGVSKTSTGRPNLQTIPDLQAMPGIHIATGWFITQQTDTVTNSAKTAGRHIKQAQLGDWLTAWVNSRYQPDHIQASHETGISVLFDGYLTHITGECLHAKSPATSILALYLESGLSFLSRLRGSYTCLIVDVRSNQVHLFNDRRASRPIFCRHNAGHALLIGPEVAALSRVAPALHEIDPVAVCEFLIFASFYNDRTLFPQVKKFPPGSVMTLSPEALTIRPYWEIRIDPDKGPSNEPELIEQGLALFNQSISRLIPATTQPFLFLSGGVDSRMILGGLRANGYQLPVATYGTSEGDDALIARQLAELCGLPFAYYPIATDNLQNHFVAASLGADCRAETIDSPSMEEMMPRLADQYHAFLNGDMIMYGRPATTHAEALSAIGVFSFTQANRLSDLLDPDVFRHTRENINMTLHAAIEAGRQLDPQDLQDKTYYEQRLVNRQNAFTAAKLRHMEPAQPWLDEDLVDFLFAMPSTMRVNKLIATRMLETAHPDLASVPFAQKDSIPHARTYRKIIPSTPALSSFIRTQFHDVLDPRLATLFRHGSLLKLVDSMLSGKPYPLTPAHWWSRLPGMWRIDSTRYASDKVHPVSVVLRLMQLNIYLDALNQRDIPQSTLN